MSQVMVHRLFKNHLKQFLSQNILNNASVLQIMNDKDADSDKHA